MVGMRRLQSIEDCCRSAIRNCILGYFVETGVWHAACSILMKAVLAATADTQHCVWLFDSFQGLPKPDPGPFLRIAMTR